MPEQVLMPSSRYETRMNPLQRHANRGRRPTNHQTSAIALAVFLLSFCECADHGRIAGYSI
jgi:hypothetical protein